MRRISQVTALLSPDRPAICIPIVGTGAEEIIRAAKDLSGDSLADIVEWRADFFRETDEQRIVGFSREIREATGTKPLILTFRTKPEGGRKDLPEDSYVSLLVRAAQEGSCEFLDAEARIGREQFSKVLEAAKRTGTAVIASRHFFVMTPSKEEMLACLQEMRSFGADIIKLAVMPSSAADTARLLEVTALMHEKYPEQLMVTMAMDRTGVASRLIGGFFGSCMTFGCRGRASAPGQVEEGILVEILNKLTAL